MSSPVLSSGDFALLSSRNLLLTEPDFHNYGVQCGGFSTLLDKFSMKWEGERHGEHRRRQCLHAVERFTQPMDLPALL